MWFESIKLELAKYEDEFCQVLDEMKPLCKTRLDAITNSAIILSDADDSLSIQNKLKQMRAQIVEYNRIFSAVTFIPKLPIVSANMIGHIRNKFNAGERLLDGKYSVAAVPKIKHVTAICWIEKSKRLLACTGRRDEILMFDANLCLIKTATSIGDLKVALPWEIRAGNRYVYITFSTNEIVIVNHELTQVANYFTLSSNFISDIHFANETLFVHCVRTNSIKTFDYLGVYQNTIEFGPVTFINRMSVLNGLIAILENEHKLQIYNIAKATFTHTLKCEHIPPIMSVCFVFDDILLHTGDGGLHLVKIDENKLSIVKTLSVPALFDRSKDLQYLADGRLLALMQQQAQLVFVEEVH